MQRTYEIMFIIRPDLTEEDNDKIISSLETQANSAGASVKHVERMGKRRLAYVVRGFQDGLYVLLTVEGSGNAVHEIERRMRVTEQVIKFITVRMDEEQKRLDKMKKLRDAKRKVSTAAAPAAEAPAAATEPSAPAPAVTQ
jgi:small subunit ribosomal protein S6